MKELIQEFKDLEPIHYFYAGVAIALAFIIWFGFDHKILKVVSCQAKHTVYMSAEFSEVETGIDFEGKFYSETNYWSETASPTYYVTMMNENIIAQNIGEFYNQAVAKPMENFEYNKGYQGSNNFDNYELKRTSIIHENYDNGDHVSIKPVEYGKCIDGIGRFTPVKYWYAISY